MSAPLPVKLSLPELAAAFERASGETSYYLDVESGVIHTVTEETRRMLYSLQEMYGADDGTLDIEAALERRDVGARIKAALRLAHRIESGYGARYRKVPESDSMAGYADMKAFADTVSDVALRDVLWHALQGVGAPARFAAALEAHPATAARWQAYRTAQAEARVRAWLAAEGIEAV